MVCCGVFDIGNLDFFFIFSKFGFVKFCNNVEGCFCLWILKDGKCKDKFYMIIDGFGIKVMFSIFKWLYIC